MDFVSQKHRQLKTGDSIHVYRQLASFFRIAPWRKVCEFVSKGRGAHASSFRKNPRQLKVPAGCGPGGISVPLGKPSVFRRLSSTATGKELRWTSFRKNTDDWPEGPLDLGLGSFFPRPGRPASGAVQCLPAPSSLTMPVTKVFASPNSISVLSM